ncbi:hypothetical protein AWC38_SpisGene23725 [Stylophora pistillata]|uniref:GIY-YIG domain-containing protein n=1 Tax=Stylophora pistillata TaxID=50429 RepID=A0A2B4R7H6_STYPI|nr:hypothetical protein AWC38_SpisGene23725 [Stylophora pistillata]
MCDIEAMFYQVRVPEEDRDLLRFLWWENGDTSREPQEYRMTVHLFGVTSSPGCSNFALKATADDNEAAVGSAAADFLRRDFYVDDGLKSVASEEESVELVKDITEMCKRGGFNLHKFTSNRKEVIQQIPVSDRAEGIKDLDFSREHLPIERALGVQWCIESDTFNFTISLRDRPCTRRGILSTISSIYGPLGFVAPVLLEGKTILQELCRNNAGWDDPVPNDVRSKWFIWKAELEELQNFAIPRCYKPIDFGRVIKAEIHHFSDASFKGYGQCSYLRLYNGKHYKQLHGTAMGSPVSVVIAEIVMQNIEERALSTCRQTIPLWLRYVDDTFTAVRHDEIDAFHNHLNEQNTDIQFTREVEENGKLPFLDCLVSHNDNSLRTTVYRKPTHTDRLLDESSYNPTSHKATTIRTLTRRAQLVCDSTDSLSDENKYLHRVFTKNNYNNDFIRRNTHRPTTTTETNDTATPTTTATIPYIKGMSENISRILLPFNIRVAHKPITTLRQLLTNVKDKDEPRNRQGTIYKINCSDCQASYIGETGRNLTTRLTEHRRATRKGDVSNHIAEHHRLTNHNIDWDSAQCLTYSTDYFQRLTLESWFTNLEQTPLNRCQQLPAPYKRLIHDINITNDRKRTT